MGTGGNWRKMAGTGPVLSTSLQILQSHNLATALRAAVWGGCFSFVFHNTHQLRLPNHHRLPCCTYQGLALGTHNRPLSTTNACSRLTRSLPRHSFVVPTSTTNMRASFVLVALVALTQFAPGASAGPAGAPDVLPEDGAQLQFRAQNVTLQSRKVQGHATHYAPQDAKQGGPISSCGKSMDDNTVRLWA